MADFAMVYMLLCYGHAWTLHAVLLCHILACSHERGKKRAVTAAQGPANKSYPIIIGNGDGKDSFSRLACLILLGSGTEAAV